MAELIGYFLTLDAIFSWGIASLVYKIGMRKTDPKANLLFRMVFVTIATFIFSLIFSTYALFSRLSSIDLMNYIFWCLMSGLSVTIGDLMYFTSLRKIDVSRAYPLTQLSLVFVYPFAFIFFGEVLSLSIILGGFLILSSVFILSSKDTSKKVSDQNNEKKPTEELTLGVLLAIGTALFWALAIVFFHQARIISGDVFITNFLRISLATGCLTIFALFKPEYFSGFKNKNRKNRKYLFYIAIAGSLSLGFADSLFYMAAEINGLVLTSTITANTPMVQQILSVLLLKEKLRKRFFIAVALIIIGNYLILFL